MHIMMTGGGRNSSFQYGKMWQNPGSVTVNSVRIAVLFGNKVHLKLLKEGCKAAPQRIAG